ncbi:DUF192 domain-containing protein [Polynucleobacter antarcticus]|nr:DUF192 domain-containing protein [Polynucleobacter antarcticus]
MTYLFMQSRHIKSILLAVSSLFFSAVVFAQQNIDLPIIELKAGIYRIQAELADTPKAREVGLMNRTSMTTNAGMLFIFEQKAGHCFWMNNTKIPLSIAFIADDGKIVNIEEMQANTTNNHCPKAAVRYALEMNKQWFSERVIVPGTVIQGLPRK